MLARLALVLAAASAAGADEELAAFAVGRDGGSSSAGSGVAPDGGGSSAASPAAPRRLPACAPGDVVRGADGASHGYRLMERVRRLGAPTTGALSPPPQTQTQSQMQTPPPAEAAGADAFARALARAAMCSPMDEAVVPAPRAPVVGPYTLDDAVGRGSMGEVWRARRVELGAGSSSGSGAGTGGGSNGAGGGGAESSGSFVLKRVFSGAAAVRSGLREVHFGLLLRESESAERRDGCARFVEHFVRGGADSADAGEPEDAAAGAMNELWLVFVDEGASLQSLLFSPVPGAAGALAPSPFWLRLRSEAAGASVLRAVLRQLAAALAALHDDEGADTSGAVVHRDVKPANVLIGASEGDSSLRVRLADFGSAVDAFAAARLYDGDGPSAADLTEAYAPPEVIFAAAGDAGAAVVGATPASDAFALGLLALEMTLGLPAGRVLAPPARLAAILRHRRAGEGAGAGEKGESALEQDLRAAGLLALCIAPDAGGDAGDEPPPAVARVRAAAAAAARGSDTPAACLDGGSLAGFRAALRVLDAEAGERARRLAAASSAAAAAAEAAEAAAAGAASATSLTAAPSSAFAAWAAGGGAGVGPLVRVRSAAAASAAFGAALVAWHAPPPATAPGLPAPPAAGDALDSGGGGGGGGVGAACALLGSEGEELLWRLLRWGPEERASMRDALASAFLAGA